MKKNKLSTKKITSSNTKRLYLGGLLALVFVFAGTSVYMYRKYSQLKNNPNASQEAATTKANTIRDKAAKLISVPSDETPTLATVTEKEKLKDQPFFKDAENGDVILIFPQAKKAYIYREREDKLINVGPIAITSDGEAAPEGTTNSTPQQ
jgi:hypothetical protein